MSLKHVKYCVDNFAARYHFFKWDKRSEVWIEQWEILSFTTFLNTILEICKCFCRCFYSDLKLERNLIKTLKHSKSSDNNFAVMENVY